MGIRQLFLDRLHEKKDLMKFPKKKISIFNWNISNPSLQRAIKQIKWLSQFGHDILILTETKSSDGCKYINNRLHSLGYQVLFPKPLVKEYGTLIASKFKVKETNFSNFINDELRTRVVSVIVLIQQKEFEIIGAYVPNRRDEQKKNFLQDLQTALLKMPQREYRVFCGDLNILEPAHYPHYSKFEKWEYDFYTFLLKNKFIDAYRYINPNIHEYSWIGRTGDKYRYDHFFVSSELLSMINDCNYLHEPRNLKLSDHSAMYLKINHLKFSNLLKY